MTADVRLGGALAGAADALTRDRVEMQLAELLGELGIDAHAAVELTAAGDDATDEPIRLSVNGRRVGFPAPLLWQALAFVEETPRTPVEAAGVADRLSQDTPAGRARAADVVAYVCRAALSAQPGVLAGHLDAGARALVELGISVGQGEARGGTDGDEAIEALISARAAGTIEVRMHPEQLREMTGEDAEAQLFPMLRDGLFVELGVPLPPLHFRADASLPARGFAFRINSLLTPPRIGLDAMSLLVNDTAERMALYRTQAEPTLNPSTQRPGAIVSGRALEELERLGFATWNSSGHMILALAAEIRTRAHTLVTGEVAAGMVAMQRPRYPALVAQSNRLLSSGFLAAVLRRLLRDGVPVRDTRRILELLLRHATSAARGGEEDGPRAAADFVRAGLADATGSRLGRGTRTVVTYLLDPALEDAVLSQGEEPVDGGVSDCVAAAVRRELSSLPETVAAPALLTRTEIRRPLQELLRAEFPYLQVIAFSDLPASYNVQPVARIAAAVSA